jgi:hypothetical protein
VIELFPVDTHEPSLFTAAAHGGLAYFHLRAEPRDHPAGTRPGAGVVIGIDQLRRLMATAGLAPAT